jgi:curved DNA-binding protein CbpA
MKKTLPDYYRILKIEPTATQEEIKASYRKLMVTLKMHPDFGGDHELAVRINEAYAVLGNSSKRISYDRLYLLQRLRAVQVQQSAAKQGSNAPSSAATGTAQTAGRPSRNAASGGVACLFCGTVAPRQIGPESRCEYCLSPLSPPPNPGLTGRELFGRRTSPRAVKTHEARIYPAGENRGYNVKMRDLSLNGMSFYSENALALLQRFKFRDPVLEAVAVVISCRKRGQLYSVHAKILTVRFHEKSGVFVSAFR